MSVKPAKCLSSKPGAIGRRARRTAIGDDVLWRVA
jgi:hypothetical protein